MKTERVGRSLSYTTDVVPIPHPSFAWYALTISEKYGLCRILAVGKEKPSDAYGESLRQDYNVLRDALVEKYGRPTLDEDGIRQGSIWNEPKDFMMGLLKGERSLTTLWKPEPSNRLPPTLSLVAVLAAAPSSSKGKVSMQYRFSNNDQFEAEEKAAQNRDL